LNSVDRYIEYQTTLQSWLSDARVIGTCAALRGLHTALAGVSLVRLVELVLFRSAK